MPQLNLPASFIILLANLLYADFAQAKLHANHGHHGQARHSHTKAPEKKVPAKAPPKEEVEEDLEQVEVVDVSPAAPASSMPHSGPAERSVDASVKTTSPQESLTLTLVLGHLHAAVVHLPIAWSMLWALSEMASLLIGQTSLFIARRWLAALTCLSFAPAIFSGLQRFTELSAMSHDASTQAAGLQHRNLMYVSLFLLTLLSIGKWRLREDSSRTLGVIYALGVCAAAGLVGYSAHLGGMMVYGEDFLPF